MDSDHLGDATREPDSQPRGKARETQGDPLSGLSIDPASGQGAIPPRGLHASTSRERALDPQANLPRQQSRDDQTTTLHDLPSDKLTPSPTGHANGSPPHLQCYHPGPPTPVNSHAINHTDDALPLAFSSVPQGDSQQDGQLDSPRATPPNDSHNPLTPPTCTPPRVPPSTHRTVPSESPPCDPLDVANGPISHPSRGGTVQRDKRNNPYQGPPRAHPVKPIDPSSTASP